MAAPLDRTWYNTLIDDDGSGTTGTIWNKTQIDGLMDTVDGSLAGLVDKGGAPVASSVALFTDADTISGGAGIIGDPSNGGLGLQGPYVYLDTHNSGAPANQRKFRIVNANTQLLFQALDDIGNPTPGTLLAINHGGSVNVPPNVQVTLDGGGITFPATQVPSANPYTLDDYREGDWTPLWLGTGGQSGQVYSQRDGRYVKKGRDVFCVGNMILSAVGTVSGNLQIGGLPFVTDFSQPAGVLTFATIWNFGLNISLIVGHVISNGTVVDLHYLPGGGAAHFGDVPASALTASTFVYFTVHYISAQ